MKHFRQLAWTAIGSWFHAFARDPITKELAGIGVESLRFDSNLSDNSTTFDGQADSKMTRKPSTNRTFAPPDSRSSVPLIGVL